MIEAYVHLDGYQSEFKCLLDPEEDWNGFAVPYFDEQTLQRVQKYLCEIDPDCDISVDGQPVYVADAVLSIGMCGFCWRRRTSTEEYVDGLGNYCPACGSGALVRMSGIRKLGRYEAVTSCSDCRSSWIEVYALTSYRNLSAPVNANCLENMICPRCRNSDKLLIGGSCVFVVTDDGIEDHTAAEWNRESPCSCPNCGFAGKLLLFDVTNTYQEGGPTENIDPAAVAGSGNAQD